MTTEAHGEQPARESQEALRAIYMSALAGHCHWCETPLMVSANGFMEECRTCGRRYQVAVIGRKRRLITSFPIPGDIKRAVSIQFLPQDAPAADGGAGEP